MAEAPKKVLGESDTRRSGGKLPYFLKVLDARTMLSLQAHSSLAQARAGFARENEAGIPLDASKPGRTSLALFAPLNTIETIVTDAIGAEDRVYLEESGIDVLAAE